MGLSNVTTMCENLYCTHYFCDVYKYVHGMHCSVYSLRSIYWAYSISHALSRQKKMDESPPSLTFQWNRKTSSPVPPSSSPSLLPLPLPSSPCAPPSLPPLPGHRKKVFTDQDDLDHNLLAPWASISTFRIQRKRFPQFKTTIMWHCSICSHVLQNPLQISKQGSEHWLWDDSVVKETTATWQPW